MSAKWQRITLELPKDLDPATREAVAADVIEHIRQRTVKGVDKNGSKFPKYSETYINSMAFKLAGKSKNRIDLTLSGDMLEALTVLSHKPGKVTIGFEKGTEENARADGNIRGAYGGSPDPNKARDFLGIDEAALDAIVRKHT